MISVGHAAHIHGAAGTPASPRYNGDLTPEQLRAITNGVWLCADCATKVDRDPIAYPAAMLQQWQAQATADARQQVHGGARLLNHNTVAASIAAKAFRQAIESIHLPASSLRRFRAPFHRSAVDNAKQFLRYVYQFRHRLDHPLHGRDPDLVSLQVHVIQHIEALVALLDDGSTYYREPFDEYYRPVPAPDAAAANRLEHHQAMIFEALDGPIRQWINGEQVYGTAPYGFGAL